LPRFFNKKQRIALELNSGGICQICSIPLPPSWHADHITPFSKEGETDVLNGQALCSRCNLRKGVSEVNKPTLRNWQQEGLDSIVKNYEDGKHCVLTQATPGGGKTILGLAVFDAMPNNHMVVVAPTTVLVSQWMNDAKKYYGLELKNSMLYSGQSDFEEYDGIVMTYGGMHENHENLRIFCSHNNAFVISDESHHISEGRKWGGSFINAFEKSGNILMLTGTPWTSTQYQIPFVEYGSDGFVKTDFEYSKVNAITDRVCRVTEFFPCKPKMVKILDKATGEETEYPSIEVAEEEGVGAAYSAVCKSLEQMKIMFTRGDEELSMLRSQGGNAGGLLVAPDINTAHLFQDEIFMLTGVEYPIVHSKMKKPQETISDFRDSNEKWLISVDMITEGVDIKRLQVCLWMSVKKTELCVRQVVGRIERVPVGEHDQTASFYYTSYTPLNDIISTIETENKAGLAALEDMREETEEREGDSSTKRISGIEVTDIESAWDDMVARGYAYDKDIVEIALTRKRGDNILFDVPLHIICKVIMAEKNAGLLMTPVALDDGADKYEVPLSVKKERIRSRISKELFRKLVGSGGMDWAKQNIKSAHRSLNIACGMTNGTNDDVSLPLLEKKMELISNNEVEIWL